MPREHPVGNCACTNNRSPHRLAAGRIRPLDLKRIFGMDFDHVPDRFGDDSFVFEAARNNPYLIKQFEFSLV